MNPIINPWLFYVAALMGGLKTLTMGLAAAIGVLLVIVIAALLATYADGYSEDNDREKFRRPVWKLTIALLIALLIAVVIPSRETVYTMMLAGCVTPDNAASVADALKEAADYIVSAFQSLK